MSNPKKCKDYLGNEYDSVKIMCDVYGIEVAAFKARINRGWSLKDALIKKSQRDTIDHLGNRYNNVDEMCRHYNISRDTYNSRLKRGWGLQRTLETAMKCSIIKDHLGNEFNSVKSMCKYYNISVNFYNDKIRQGWDLKTILEYQRSITDYLGNKFKTEKDMCEYHGVPYKLYLSRKGRGKGLEEALQPYSKNKIIDPNGIEYKSYIDMCKAWNVNIFSFQQRKNKGWTLLECLEGKKIQIFGTSYNSLTEIAHENKNGITTICNRVNKGYDLELLKINSNNHRIFLKFIGLDNKAYYSVPWSNTYVTVREILQHYKPELVSLYDKYNPTGKYNPYIL